MNLEKNEERILARMRKKTRGCRGEETRGLWRWKSRGMDNDGTWLWPHQNSSCHANSTPFPPFLFHVN